MLDTNSIISYFSNIFNEKCCISDRAISLIERAFNKEGNIRISIPSICFVEIYNKFCTSEEILANIKYEIFSRIRMCDYFEIRECSDELFEHFIELDDKIENLENHDKLVLSTAIELDASLITSDMKIASYVDKSNLNISIIS